MISALLYLQYHSTRNRIAMRVKRLRQPKYLIGAIAGGFYFYFYFFRYLFANRSARGAVSFSASPSDVVLYESFGAIILLLLVLRAWLVPSKRAALTFSEAEIAFLFPAPVSRRGLIHFKLVRSQAAILFTTFLLTIVLNRFGGRSWIHAAGWWLILSTLNLHFLGASFVRTILLDKGITNWQRRMGVLFVLILATTVVVVWARRTMPGITANSLQTVDAAKNYVYQLLALGPAPFLLYPFRVMVRPYLAGTAREFLFAAAPAILVMLLHYIWVIRSNVAFEEASVEASQKLAEKITTSKGRGQAKRTVRKRRPPFTLRPSGLPAVALFWKNLISAGGAFRPGILLAFLGGTIAASVAVGKGFENGGLVSTLGILAAMFLFWSLLYGPQVLRQDFRQDLTAADLLKSYPMRGWQVALGELLAPAAILTGIQWVLLTIAACMLRQSPDFNRPITMSGALGAAIIFPMLNLIAFQIPNAAVLLFPSWFQTTRESTHGIEITGQRLIFMIGHLTAFIITLIPAAGVFVMVFALLKLFVVIGLVIPIASLAAACILGVEAGVGILLLGWLFERFDLSSEALT